MKSSSNNDNAIWQFIQFVNHALNFSHVSKAELRLLVWAWMYIFVLFLCYYILRPIRDELGVAGGVKNLPWLFTGTLLAMLLVNPLFAYLVKRCSRERFIKLTYRFFSLNLLAFLIALKFSSAEQNIWIGRMFFIWVSVFNLFVVSVFWSFIVDIFNSEQGKRLFGFLAAGATLGGIAGSSLTSGMVEDIGQNGLLFIAMILIECSVFASQRLAKAHHRQNAAAEQAIDDQQPIGGGIFTGMAHTFRSPYLFAIALFIFFYSTTSTILYFHQASIAESVFSDRNSRTAFFANIDFWVNVFTLVFQLLLTGRILGWLGVACTLCALPLISVLGFAALIGYPSIGLFVAVQVARRVSNFALARPAREILFTSVTREDRYKTKNFIDTFVYRAGDQLASWTYAGFVAAGLSISGIAIVAVPVSCLWLILSIWLGRKHEKWATITRQQHGIIPLSVKGD
ncbi:AAA family ATP:ADP antiporter [Erwinia toletana]|uniref:AAA family ATP:ADP antiporter n=1 Tax=Winslowiella toletana TaxID=92490 RepID=A0ABS4PDQ5_9GAMM|nr:MFS transporter [Winslowiella toletana]MBP2170763.1 AAA family ATP:ADP antiporter [Winslowiella toletana]